MKKTLIYILTSLAMLGSAMAQAAPDPAPAAQAPVEVPKTKGAYLIVALQPQPLTIQFTNAQTCETERSRIKEQGLISYCIWVR